MARKKFSPLVTIINLYNTLSAGDKPVFEEFIRSQQPPRKKGVKGSGKKKAQDDQMQPDSEAERVQ